MAKKFTIKNQLDLLHKCEETGQSLSSALQEKHMTYDNLMYQTYSNNALQLPEIERIEDVVRYFDNIPAVSFFAGAGGLDIGFSYAGFNTIASIELVELFCNIKCSIVRSSVWHNYKFLIETLSFIPFHTTIWKSQLIISLFI